MRSPVELSVEPEFRRGHGSVYDALAGGRIDAGRLRRLQVAAMAPAAPEDPLMFGIDVTPLARPDAVFADEMVMVQVRGAGGDRYLPGWPLSVLVGVQWGSSSWVDAIEARRLRPGEDHAGATVAQITDLLGDLAATGKWRPADPPPLVMLDAGYPATDICHALAGQPVQVLARLRSDRVFYADPGPRAPGQRGAPRRHGQRFALAGARTHHAPDVELAGDSARYGKVRVRAWHGLHQALGVLPAAGQRSLDGTGVHAHPELGGDGPGQLGGLPALARYRNWFGLLLYDPGSMLGADVPECAPCPG